MTATRPFEVIVRLVALLLAVLPAAAEAATIVVGGRERSFEMYVPPTAPRPLPVVLILHGGGATSGQVRRYTDFDRVAQRENVLAVYPQAINGHWNDGRPEIVNMDSGSARTNDIKFLLAIVDMLAERGLADRNRVFAAGISNGGMMVLRLACTAPSKIAGAAVVAANQPAKVACAPQVPVPMMFFHGTEDKFIPYRGGEILQWANIDRGKVLSADGTVGQWLAINGCTGNPNPLLVANKVGGTNIKIDAVTYEPCQKAPVIRYIIKGGGHAWPGAHQSRAGNILLGPASTGIDASEEIWRFFDSLPPRTGANPRTGSGSL